MAIPRPQPVQVVELEPRSVAILRSIVAPDDFPEFLADALATVAEALAAAGGAAGGPPFARYLGAGPEGLDVAVGYPVAEPFIGRGNVHGGELPGGPAAVGTHLGSYAGLDAAWSALKAGIDALGRSRAEDPWEIYFVGPGSGVDPSAWRTELVWPLRPSAAGG